MLAAHLNLLEFSGFILCGGLLAGLLGSLTGLGGGVAIVPLLTLVFGVDIRYAIGASLISVIATSSGPPRPMSKKAIRTFAWPCFWRWPLPPALCWRRGRRVRSPRAGIAVIFGVVLLVLGGVFHAGAGGEGDPAGQPDRLAALLRLDGQYPTAGGKRHYHVRRVPLGFFLMLIAGAISGLLGIGSGALKVLALDQAMRIPFKVSTTTSNFMIGVTAAAGAAVLSIAATSIRRLPCRSCWACWRGPWWARTCWPGCGPGSCAGSS